jgi:hypothetical protein
MAAGHARKYKTHRPTNPAAAMVPNRTVNNSETDDKTVITNAMLARAVYITNIQYYS